MRRTLRPDAVLVQAVIAGALSFAHLHDLAEAAGQHGWKAWAYPVSVDLLLVAAWRRMRTLRSRQEPAGAAWTWFTIALAASLGANIATAGLLDLDHVPAWLRILVAGWPALAFLGGTLLAHTSSPEPRPEPAPHESPAPRVEVEREPAPEPVPAEIAPAEPAEPAAPAVDVPTPPSVPAPVLPAALIAHARKIADDHHATTGNPIDATTLRTRLGVPEPLAVAITAQLT